MTAWVLAATAFALDYAHRPLVKQFDAGRASWRSTSTTIAVGGHYARGLDDPALTRSGFNVLHIPGIDNVSHCTLLTDCLRTIRRWSDAHPQYVPILLLFNTRDERNATRGGIDALPFDAVARDALDAEARLVVTPGKLVTPDDVRDRYPTLRDAVLASAAQYVSTDYLWPDDPRFAGGYRVRPPGGGARCNPVRRPRRDRRATPTTAAYSWRRKGWKPALDAGDARRDRRRLHHFRLRARRRPVPAVDCVTARSGVISFAQS